MLVEDFQVLSPDSRDLHLQITDQGRTHQPTIYLGLALVIVRSDILRC